MIRVSNLSFTYPGSPAPAVDGIAFSVPKGEIFGFLGPNGSGKSTTQKIIIGLLKGYRGEVEVLGRDLAEWDAGYYERIGVCFELPNHYPKLTALENLRLFSSFYEKETEDPLEMLRLVGLEDNAEKRVESFSKGMRMKLNLARSLLHDPEILFLDEPTSGLDPSSARAVKDIILEKKREGKTIFLTTHNMEIADELCDTVSFIVNGKICLTEHPWQLRQDYGKRTVRVEYVLDGQIESAEYPLEGLGYSAEFLSLLRDEEIRTIHSKEATMEDIFLSVTGRRLS